MWNQLRKRHHSFFTFTSYPAMSCNRSGDLPGNSFKSLRSKRNLQLLELRWTTRQRIYRRQVHKIHPPSHFIAYAVLGLPKRMSTWKTIAKHHSVMLLTRNYSKTERGILKSMTYVLGIRYLKDIKRLSTLRSNMFWLSYTN